MNYDNNKLMIHSIAYLESKPKKMNSKECKFWYSHIKYVCNYLLETIVKNPEIDQWRIFIDQFDYDDWEPDYIGFGIDVELDMFCKGIKINNPIMSNHIFYPPEMDLLRSIVTDNDIRDGYTSDDLATLLNMIIQYVDSEK